MSANSGIEWTEATWQVTSGCTKVSPGCKNCYAETMAKRLAGMARADVAAGRNPGRKASYPLVVTDAGAWNNKVVTLPDNLTIPLKRKKPCTYFVDSMSDLFHEGVPFGFVDKVFAIMALCRQHTFQLLTKRVERGAEYLNAEGCGKRISQAALPFCRSDIIPEIIPEFSTHSVITKWPLPNVWLGTSVENQECADKRIPHLLNCPAAVRFLSCEPLLGPMELRDLLMGTDRNHGSCLVCGNTIGCECPGDGAMIQWVIVGGESGHGSRPCNVEWVRSIVKQCAAAGVACFVKQLGARCTAGYYDTELREQYESRGQEWPEPIGWSYRDGQPPIGSRIELTMKSVKGGDMAEWPEDLRIRQMPKVEVSTC